MSAAPRPVRQQRLSPLTDGQRYESVRLTAEADGSLRLVSHQMGASDLAAWGQDDAEIELTIAPSQVAALALVLLADQLGRGPAAVAKLAALCEEHDVAYRIANWS